MFVYLTNRLGQKFPVNATLVRALEARPKNGSIHAYLSFDDVHGFEIRETVEEAAKLLNTVATGGVIVNGS